MLVFLFLTTSRGMSTTSTTTASSTASFFFSSERLRLLGLLMGGRDGGHDGSGRLVGL
jgi:hypothetical protein